MKVFSAWINLMHILKVYAAFRRLSKNNIKIDFY